MGDSANETILKFWFGRPEEAVLPSEERAQVWFGDSPEVDKEIKSRFSEYLKQAIAGQCTEWEQTSRAQLALIILLDQFSRHIYRNSPDAFAQDDYALSVCLRGLEKQHDHQLDLMERVFYYYPLLHSEHLVHQERSLQAYQSLMEVAFPETQIIYESFLKFANHHYTIIRRFGRFPQRNVVLSRESTDEETNYLKEVQQFRG
jgi:uncharacterized protein (DUF924 family)